MNTIEIKTNLSGEKLQMLMWDLEAFCDLNGLPKPVLQQCNVSGQSEQLVCDENELDCPYEFTSRCTMGRCDCKPKQTNCH